MWLPPVSSQGIISNKLTMFKIYKSQAFLSTSSQSRISLVEEKNSWSSTASSEATKREKVVTEMLSIHMLSSSNSALVAKNLGNYTAATSILAWAFLCPPPLWSIVPCANLRRSQAFIYLKAEVRMDINLCICQDEDKDEYEYEDDDDDRSKSNKTKTSETPQVESSTESSSRAGNDWRLFLKRVS